MHFNGSVRAREWVRRVHISLTSDKHSVESLFGLQHENTKPKKNKRNSFKSFDSIQVFLKDAETNTCYCLTYVFLLSFKIITNNLLHMLGCFFLSTYHKCYIINIYDMLKIHVCEEIEFLNFPIQRRFTYNLIQLYNVIDITVYRNNHTIFTCCLNDNIQGVPKLQIPSAILKIVKLSPSKECFITNLIS